MSSLLQLIELKRNNSAKTWAKIADFILADPKHITSLTLREFSEQAVVSEGSIVNFVYSLGYKGYTEFKVGVAQSLGFYVNKFTGAKDGLELCTQIVNATKESLDKTLLALNDKTIEKISKKIANIKGRVYVCGRSTSGHIANILAGHLMRMGISAFSYDDHFAVAKSLNKNDMMIVITYSGETDEIYEAVNVAKQKGAYTVCITSFPQSRIATICEDCLESVAFEAKEGGFPIIARSVQLTLCNIICTRVFSLKQLDK